MPFSFPGFAALLEQYIDDLPDVVFSEDSEFAQIHQFISEKIQVAIDPDTSVSDAINMIVDQIEAIMADPANNSRLADLDRAAGLLTQQVSGSFQQLRYNISDQVDALASEINEEFTKELRSQGAEILLGDQEEPSVDFGVIRWGTLSQGNYVNEVIENASAIAGLRDKKVSQTNWNYIKNKLPLQGFQPIDIHQDIFADFCDKVNNVVTTHNLEECTDVLRIFLKAQRFSGFCNNIGRKATGRPEDFSWLLDRVNLVKQVLKAVAIVPMDLSDETKAKLQDNVKLVRQGVSAAEFYLLVLKEKYQNSLILSPELLNGEVLTKFTNSGGTMADIAYHLRAYYDEVAVPMAGVDLNRVLEFKTRVNEIITSKNAQVKMKMTVIKAKAMNAAFHRILDNYLRTLPQEALPENHSPKSFYLDKYPQITKVMDQFQAQQDNVTDAVYRFVLAVWHDGQLVQTLFNYLGKEYVRLAERADIKNDENTVAVADAYVVATLVGEYFAKRHVTPIAA